MDKVAITKRDVRCVLGLVYDVTNLNAAVTTVNTSIEQDERCFLTTPNLNFVIASQSDTAFFQSVVDSDLSVADGMPLIWVAKLLDIPLPERVAGSSLFDELSKQNSCPEKIKVFFFGGQDGVAEQAHRKLNESSSAMMSCGFYDPGFVSVEEMSSPDIVEQINAAAPDFIVVALGAKKGQAWIQQNKQQLNASVISHLGAVINFVAGHVERAPVFWQRCGLEWLWRIKQEPTLWRRYLFDGLAFIKLLISHVFPLA
ncbi:MAG: WecB/TagA/CpsF family glycosyltransferase, partial [Psychrosphaera sp.]|nr:WecB/TagA/CpsF family glycosyltransferase [Psychrosphaera sp.]